MESVRNEPSFFNSLMKGLSEIFGGKCEIVLHDHKEQTYENNVIAIENGYITGRSVRDCNINLDLEMPGGDI